MITHDDVIKAAKYRYAGDEFITNVIHINIAGPVQSGKSTVLATIHNVLRQHGYCVAIPDSEYRNNPANPLHAADEHEKPIKDKTVFVLSETVTK